MDGRPRSPLRLLAPLALVAFGLVFLVVAAGSMGGDASDSSSPVDSRAASKSKAEKVPETATSVSSDTATEGTESLGPKRASYTVKAGDTLDGIAAKTGATVDAIRELNPAIDPQALIAGTELQLRE